ncbi:hypothetical protein CTRU02_210580 [Colletotrichum truncatum]|uniref:Uncharacterized protein n=1 Tax=Colletotrichum truncatum TaxID=5467 RepID=A0ACC3YPD9_COLTU|nr:hypothetical protein CTRU02_12783 [Colletotrichum truncatum]
MATENFTTKPSALVIGRSEFIPT